MASFIIPEDGFNITDHGPDVVPPLILQAEVQTLYIEFLKMDTDGRTAEEIASLKNHAILKADFVRDIDIYSGARINMVVNFDVLSETSAGGNSHKLGMLLVRPIKYRASSFSSACTAVLPLKQRVTFEHLIRAITDNNLQYFYFCTVDEKYYGCRDFVTQATAQLIRYNYVEPEIGPHFPQHLVIPSKNVYHLLGNRFPVGGNPTPCPVDLGWFRYFTRNISSDMQYKA